MDVDRALSAGSLEVRAAEKDEPAIGGRGDLVYGLDRLPMARDPQGLSALLDGAGLFLR